MISHSSTSESYNGGQREKVEICSHAQVPLLVYALTVQTAQMQLDCCGTGIHRHELRVVYWEFTGGIDGAAPKVMGWSQFESMRWISTTHASPGSL